MIERRLFSRLSARKRFIKKSFIRERLIRKWLLGCCLCLVVSPAAAVDDIYYGLSQFEQFRVYPYVDKAFALENSRQYQAADAELKKALAVKPEAVGLLQYALELGIKLQLPASELRSRLNRIPAEHRNEQAFLLAMMVVKPGRLLTPANLNTITQGLTDEQYDQVYLTNLYALEDKSGKHAALAWSELVPDRNKAEAVLRYQANVNFEYKNFAAAADQIQRIKPEHRLAEDLVTLGLSYISLGEEQAYRQLLAEHDLPPEAIIRMQRRYISALIYQGRDSEAKKSLLELQKITSLTEDEAAQLAWIYLAEEEERRQAALAASCLAQVEVRIQAENFRQAKQVMSGCDPQEETSRWLNYVQILDRYDLLEPVVFQGNNELTRKRLLADHYAGKDQWRKTIRLLSSAQSVESLEQLATAYARLELYRRSAQVWMKLFIRTKDISYLNLATFQADHLIDKLFLRQLFEQGQQIRSEAMFAHRELHDRLVALITEHLALFGPNEVDRLHHQLADPAISPALWKYQNLCDRLDADYHAPFLIKAKAFCLADSDAELSVALYQDATARQKHPDDDLALAVWNSLLSRYEIAMTHWEQVDITQETQAQRYLHIQALMENGRTSEAETLWQKYHQQNLQWDLLAAEIALKAGDEQRAYQHYYTVFQQYDSAEATNWLYQYAADDGHSVAFRSVDLRQTDSLTRQILDSENKVHSAAEAAYLMTSVDSQQAELLFQKAAFTKPYNENAYFHSAFADVAAQNGHKRLAEWLYQENIDRIVAQPEAEPDLLAYQQRAFRDLAVGWQFSIEGWVGHSRGATAPGLSGKAGDYFVREEAKYYFDSPPLRDSAVFLAMQHSQVFDSGAGDFSSSELDAGYQFRLIYPMNYYLDLGVRQSLNSEDYTDPYIRLKADVFSRDDWSKSWQKDKGSWLYQYLYIDGVNYLNDFSVYNLYSRYSVGRTFKLREENRHRLTPYLFVQWGKVDEQQPDKRAGAGVSWRWEFSRDLYEGYGTIADLGVEWQHITDTPDERNTESYLLRFSFFF